MKKITYIFILLFCSFRVQAISGIVFYNLSVSNGLSYNEANNMCVDRKGNLWVSTGRGLNMFNGQRVTRYFAEQYPQFQNNNVQYVTCDSNDQIWLLTVGGHVSMLDQRRSPHRFGLYNDSEFVKTTNIMVTKRGGVVLRTSKGLFRYPYSHKAAQQDSISIKHLIPLKLGDLNTNQLQDISQIQYFDEDRYIFKIDNSIHLVNLFSNSIEYISPGQDCRVLSKWNEDEALVYHLKEKKLKVIHFKTGQWTDPFQTLRDQYGRELTANFNGAIRLNLSEYLLLTAGDGIFIFNRSSGKIKQYTSDAANPTSLAKNRQTNAVIGTNGWVFINCRPNGISYFNNNDIIGSQNNFHDKKGNGYQGNISSLSTADNNAFFIGYPEGLIYWKRDINESTFLDYPDGKGGWLIKKREVKSTAIDQKGRVWIGTVNNGVVVIDKNLRFLKHIPSDTVKADCIPITSLSQVLLSPSGEIWVSGLSGICKIDPETYHVTNMKGSPVQSANWRYYPMMFRGKNDLYVGISHLGVYHYNLASGTVDSFTKSNGLRNLTFYALNFDNEGTFYVGTAEGVTLFFSNGKSKTYAQKDGLLIDGAEGLLFDRSNRMWIGNDVGLVCYNVKDSSIKTYDERYGLSIFGFLIGAYFQLSSGEFIFGTPRGLQYFYPDSLVNKQLRLNVSITRIESRDIQTNVNGTESFKLRPSDNLVTFRFSSVEYFPHVRTFYEYKLQGIDKDWVRITDESSVTYNTLPSGDYVFEVRVSNDAKHWQISDNKIILLIATPFYKTWWFIILALMAGMLMLNYLYRQFKKRQQERERNLETELVITYFASQINSHKNEEDLLWDIAKNCISKLNFDDCVIYLVDENRQVLVQKAAYGPKNPVDILIHQPIEIPLGKGICGEVALRGEAEIVDDTSIDPRYIVDDKRRFSEISIPIKIDQKVIGVIDSEHPQKRFFTTQHRQILSTISFLCANQLMKIRTEEKTQRTALELLENRQKATESRLQSLRLQMNPHFLFNALNSIQQMILANEDLVATSYLSRFSKLLRAILVSSDKEMSSLKEEIEILRMYIELESVRFKDAFEYTIHYDEELEIEEIKIPTMLIQPFVENAVWHGLMHKDGNRQLEVRFLEKGNYLQCVVKDNGVGRAAANEWRTVAGREKKHVSKGITVAEERLRTLSDSSSKQGSVEIIDLFENGLPAGTKVIINFPI